MTGFKNKSPRHMIRSALFCSDTWEVLPGRLQAELSERHGVSYHSQNPNFTNRCCPLQQRTDKSWPRRNVNF